MREVDGRYGRVPECSENGVSLSVSRGGLSLSLSLSGVWAFGGLVSCDWV